MSTYWWQKGDLDGFIALGLDNLLMLILMSAFCLGFPLEFPPEVFYLNVLPAAGVAVLVGNIYYAILARNISSRTGRRDVCALPFGINIITLIAFVFLILYPAKLSAVASGMSPEEASLASWRAGIIACVIAGLIEVGGAFVAERVRRLTPLPALLAAVGGIALCFLAMDFIFRAFSYPIVGVVTFGLAILLYFSGVRLPWKAPTGLVVLFLGIGISWSLSGWGLVDLVPVGTIESAFIGLNWPYPVAEQLWIALPLALEFLPAILPISVISVLVALQNIEAAATAGDEYKSVPCLAYSGTSTILAGVCGCPFPTSVYLGHPAWKAIGARAGYSIANGVFVLAVCLTGSLSYIVYFVPIEAGMAILIWIGVATTSKAVQAVHVRYIPAIIIGFVPVVAAFCALLVKRTMLSLGYGASDMPFPVNIEELFASNTDFFAAGMFALEQGYVYSSMVWAATTACAIDRRFGAAAIWLFIGALLSSIGFMHSYEVLHADVRGVMGVSIDGFLGAYLVLAICALLLAVLERFEPYRSEHNTNEA